MTAPRRTDEPAPATPVWAPNPGVPIIARILAYSFGAFMLLTVVATCLTPQAPDTPPVPRAWATHRMPSGVTVPYPEGWQVQADNDEDMEKITVALMPGSPVTLDVLVPKKLDGAGPRYVEMVNRRLEDVMSRTFAKSAFTFQGDGSPVSSYRGRLFTFTEQDQKMTGGWAIVPRKRTLICLVAFAPTEGWPAMQVILTQMATQAAGG